MTIEKEPVCMHLERTADVYAFGVSPAALFR